MIDTSKYPMAHRIQIPRRYVPSYATDIRKTFERERARLALEAARHGDFSDLRRAAREMGGRDMVALIVNRDYLAPLSRPFNPSDLF